MVDYDDLVRLTGLSHRRGIWNGKQKIMWK